MRGDCQSKYTQCRKRQRELLLCVKALLKGMDRSQVFPERRHFHLPAAETGRDEQVCTRTEKAKRRTISLSFCRFQFGGLHTCRAANRRSSGGSPSGKPPPCSYERGRANMERESKPMRKA